MRGRAADGLPMRIVSTPERSAPSSTTAAASPREGSFAEAMQQASEAAAPAPSAWPQVASGLAHEIDRGEAMVRSVAQSAGASLGAADLLRLQIGMYRYSESVDLAAKCVDRATSAVKTLVQQQ